jgi:hypothetical protein
MAKVWHATLHGAGTRITKFVPLFGSQSRYCVDPHTTSFSHACCGHSFPGIYHNPDTFELLDPPSLPRPPVSRCVRVRRQCRQTERETSSVGGEIYQLYLLESRLNVPEDHLLFSSLILVHPDGAY